MQGYTMGSVDWARSSRDARTRVKKALLNYEYVQSRNTEAELQSAIAEWETVLDSWTEEFRTLVELGAEKPFGRP